MQNERILRHLRSGKTLTPLQALHRFGCLRLSGRIYELRALGHGIASALVKRNGKRIAQYRMAH